jgi:threonine dehydrogenase-like Zn-dependent dehydrogenase
VGADHAVDVESKDVVKFVADLTGGKMADVVLDAAGGNPVTIPLGLELARVGGSLVLAGMKDRPLDGFDVNVIPLRHVTLFPGGGFDLVQACTLINQGKVPTAELRGESFPLEQFERRSRSWSTTCLAAMPCASP